MPSGGGWLVCQLWVVEGAVAGHGVRDGDAAVGQGKGPSVYLVWSALVVGVADGVGSEGGEGGAEHGSLEPLAAGVGDASRP